jgi:hypothetical protein
VTLAPASAGGPPTPGAGGPERPPPGLGRLAFWSATSALAALVPVPFLDDHLVRVTRRRMVRELARERGVALRENEVRLLAGLGRSLDSGCVIALLITLTVRTALALVRRLFRTLFFWLALKDASTAASFTFHEGFLLRRALRELQPQSLWAPPAGVAEPPPRAEVQRLRDVVERVVAEIDPRPLTQAFRGALRGSSWLLRGTVRRIRRVLLGVREEEATARTLEQEVPASLVERFNRALSAQGAYLEDVYRRIELALAEAAAAAAHPPAPAHPPPPPGADTTAAPTLEGESPHS